MGRSRRLALAAGLLLLVSLAVASDGALAATPAGVTVTPGGPSASWSGTITGQGDTSNAIAPQPLPACLPPGCDDETVTLAAPSTSPIYALTATLNYAENQSTATNDFFILDSARNVLATSGGSYAASLTIVANNVAPGAYTVEVDGQQTLTDNNNTVPAPYTASVRATTVSLPNLPDQLKFAPATVVSPTFLGAEPQVSIERPTGSSVAGDLNADRLFIDWPLSSRSNIGQVSRSTDGGDSFRLLYDPSCAERSRPMCTTGGGGDTVVRVNQYDGSVYFADQEVLVSEAFAASHDHGDSFPATSATPLGTSGTDVDRQWIATVDAPPDKYTLPGGVEQIRGFLSYHQPAADATIEAIDQHDLVIPQPVPQVPLVGQSGPMRVDSVHGYVYLPYRDTITPSTLGVSFYLAVAPIDSYQDPTAWHTMPIISPTADPNSFPWISLDTAGNLYAAWTNGNGPSYYSYSLWSDPADDPSKGGVPGTKWAAPIKVSIPQVGSTYFTSVVAGDPGRVAVAYMGTPDYTGAPPGAPASARWYTFVAETTDGLSASPHWLTGMVSHHPDHTGGICTSGTTCAAMPGPAGDRSLLDMIYPDVDSDGRPGVVFMNNDNQAARDSGSMGQLGSPFVKFAKLTSGPSLYTSHAAIAFANRSASVTQPHGRADWPTTAAGSDLPALDELGTSLYPDSAGNIVARIDLADASTSAATSALSAISANAEGNPFISRLQYVVRWETENQVAYLAMDVDSSGNRTYYGGVLNGNALLLNPASPTGKVAAGYPDTGIKVVGQVVGNSVYLTAAGNDLQTHGTTPVYSVTAFAMTGPSATEETLLTPMRVVDATPPFDGLGTFQASVLGARASGPNSAAGATTNPFTRGDDLAVGELLGGGIAALGLLVLLVAGSFLRRRPS